MTNPHTCPARRLFGASGRLTAAIYDRVDAVPSDDWDRVVQDRNVFLSRSCLRAVEASGGPICCAMFYLSGLPVGAAVFQRAQFQGAPLQGYLAPVCRAVDWLWRPLRIIREPFRLSLTVCGTPFASGEHGYVFTSDATPAAAADALYRAAGAARRRLDEHAETPSSGILFKEFYPSDNSPAAMLDKKRFTALPTDPAMVLFIDPTWKSFDDYLDSLSSKYRVKAKREFAKSAELTIRDLGVNELSEISKHVGTLYNAVVDRAEYKLGDLNTDTLMHLRREMGTEFILQGYFIDDRLVGFLSGFENGDTLEAGVVGFDYALNRQYAIYPRMLYDYLIIAMQRELSQVNYGRTASEIKSTLGAVPLSLSCCLQLRSNSLNSILPLVSGRIRPKSFVWRKPFKQSWYTRSRANVLPISFAPPERRLPPSIFQGGEV